MHISGGTLNRAHWRPTVDRRAHHRPAGNSNRGIDTRSIYTYITLANVIGMSHEPNNEHGVAGAIPR